MTFDTLEHNGTERAFANWGFAAKARTANGTIRARIFFARPSPQHRFGRADFSLRNARHHSTGRASATGADNSSAAARRNFPANAWATPPPPAAMRRASIRILGPWYDLTNTHYLQLSRRGGAAYAPGEVGSTPRPRTISRSFVHQHRRSNPIILQWLLDQYAAQGMSAPFQYTAALSTPARLI